MLDILKQDDEPIPHDCFYINENSKMSMFSTYDNSYLSEVALYVTSDSRALIKFVLTKRQLIGFMFDTLKAGFKILLDIDKDRIINLYRKDRGNSVKL